MKKRTRPDVRPGQVWRDRDKRELSGNRRVRVLSTIRDGDVCSVKYRVVAGLNDVEYGSVLTSRYERFQRAFDLIQTVDAVAAPMESATPSQRA